MAFLNLSFETVGPQAGCASGWVFASHSSRSFALFGTSPWETFEEGWDSNEAYKFAFSGFTIDLEQGEFVTLQPFIKLYEDFDEKWSTNELYVYTLASTPADYDTGSPEPVENFEEEWDSNETYAYDLVATAASYDATPEDFEDFEDEWFAAGAYLFAFVGYGTDLALAQYDVALENFENFEDEWPLVVMTTI